jgi:flagellar hook-associated protein 2
MTAPVSSSGSTTPTTSGTSSSGSSATSGLTSNLGGSQLFQISGLASGLDTNAIIQKLVAVYTAPEQLVQAQEVQTQAEQAAWTDIQSKVQTLQTAIQTLQGASAAAGRVGTTTPPSGGTAAVSVTATPSAALGSFAVNVQSLATTGVLNGGANFSAKITGAQATTTPITGLNMGVTPTLGTFTVNGAQITVDSSTTLLGGSGDTLQAQLAAAGVTMTAITDGGGNVTGVQLTSATPLQLGAPGDTSNMLTALRLTTAAPTGGGTTIASNGSLSGSALTTALPSLKLATPLVSSDGTIVVNGVNIAYSSTDTLGSLIGKINQSNAGVTATYDSLSDRMVLTANSTGTGGITVADTGGGNLAAALNLTTGAGAVDTPGAPAVFTVSGINGGNPIASASNTVTNIVPGITLTLTGTSPSMTPAGATTVNIAPDTTALTNALQGFVTAYNAVQDDITKYTGITSDSSGNVQNAGLLSGDPTLASLASDLDQTLNATTVSLGGKQYSLASLGISTSPATGISGSDVPTLDLQFDTSTLTSALATTPTLAQAFVGNGTVASQQGTVFQNLNDLLNNWTSPLGNFGSTLDSLTAQYADEQQQIQNWQTIAQNEQNQLSTMFTAMETSLSQLQAQGQALNAALGTTIGSGSNSSGTSGTSGSSGSSTGG